MCPVSGFFINHWILKKRKVLSWYIHTPSQEIKGRWTKIEDLLENISYFRGEESMSVKIMVSVGMNAHLVFSLFSFLLPGPPGQIYYPWLKKGFFFPP